MPTPTIYSFTIEDYTGAKSSAKFYVGYDAATETAGALTGNLAALGGLLDAVTAGKIIDARILIDVAPDPSWKAAALANLEVEQTLLLNFNQAGSKYASSVDIPDLRDTLIDAAGKPIIATGAIATLVSNLTNQTTGIGGSTTVFGNSAFLNALESLRDAAVAFRKHRRKRKSISTRLP
jgi:hypothetical protein